MSFPTEGAGIACHVCGARPFAEDWGLPAALDCHDLIKSGDKWSCPQHRVRAPTSVQSSRVESEVEPLLRELAGLVANMSAVIDEDDDENGEVFAAVDEDEREVALDLINRVGVAAAQLRKRVARP
jgi:hypothetical protein